MPPGVINMVTGHGTHTSDVVFADADLAGIHFTGSTPVFQSFWKRMADNLTSYRSYPRLVGETGGKDFVVAHTSADIDVLRTALVRGAFEYQGQKCSAASRAYVPRSLWGELRDALASDVDGLSMGDVTDLSNFMGAVIDQKAFAKHADVLQRAASDPDIEVLAGGTADDSDGWFVRPTVLVGTDPTHDIFISEYFGPILGVHVYEDDQFDAMLDADGGDQPLRADRIDHRPRPSGRGQGCRQAPLRCRQLLRERQADGCRRRSAAVRRCAGPAGPTTRPAARST